MSVWGSNRMCVCVLGGGGTSATDPWSLVGVMSVHNLSESLSLTLE